MKERSRNKVKQGSKKILIETGHGANCLYGNEGHSRIVDQLLMIVVMGNVPKQHLGRKFIDLADVMKYHHVSHETDMQIDDKRGISIKLIRAEQNVSADEMADGIMAENEHKYKHLFNRVSNR